MLDLLCALLEGLVWCWAFDDEDRARWLVIVIVVLMVLLVAGGAMLLLMR